MPRLKFCYVEYRMVPNATNPNFLPFGKSFGFVFLIECDQCGLFSKIYTKDVWNSMLLSSDFCVKYFITLPVCEGEDNE